MLISRQGLTAAEQEDVNLTHSYLSFVSSCKSARLSLCTLCTFVRRSERGLASWDFGQLGCMNNARASNEIELGQLYAAFGPGHVLSIYQLKKSGSPPKTLGDFLSRPDYYLSETVAVLEMAMPLYEAFDDERKGYAVESLASASHLRARRDVGSQ